MKRLLITLLFLWVFSCVTNAQQFQFKNYKVEEGLISNETFDIFQDSKNRIWVAANGGVSCFDGKNFTNYTTEDGLPSNICFRVFEDSKGRIWVGTDGKGVSYIENGKVITPKGIDFKSLSNTTSFLEDKEGNIYIYFIRGIAKYSNGKLEYISENEDFHFQNAAWYDSNTIYIASTRTGIFKMTLNPFKIENIFNQDNGVNNICYSVMIDKNKDVWVGAYGELNKITNGELTNYKFKPEDFDKNRIHGILNKSENELYLSLEGNGLGIFNKNTGSLETINEAQGLPSKYIYKTIKDTEDNYWMISYGEGIIRFRDPSFKIYNQVLGLPSESINAAANWNDELILATDKGLVSVSKNLDLKTLVKDVSIKSVITTPSNNLLYSTYDEVWELSENESPKLLDKGVYTFIYSDIKNTFLFETNRIKAFSQDSTYYINTSRSIAIQPIADRYILCKFSGLFEMKGSKIHSIPGLSHQEHSNFRSIDAISENELIAGSESKIYYLKLSNNEYEIKMFDMKRFEKMKRFRALKVDGENLWLAGQDLFMKVNLTQLLKNDRIIAKAYKTVPHFLKNDVDFNALSVTPSKKVIATSLGGLLVFDEKEYIPSTKPAKLDLSNVMLFSEPLDDSLYRTKRGLVLPHQKNYLSFSMQAITFTKPENVLYKFRMKGLRDGDEWSLPRKDPNAVFSYLPPGDYTFEFTADNGSGIWQKETYKYSFVITVPFWKTGIFWITIISISSLVVFLFYYYQNKAERKRNETYTHNLIKAQEAERTRVARELHDSVGQKLMLLTKKTKTTGNAEMEILATNTLTELRAISRGLHPAILERLGPTAAIINMINEVDNNTNIFFTHEIENIDSLLSKEASLHLYRIIQEALSNMVKHAEAKAASITIQKKINSIETTISDNGKGFEHSDKIKSKTSLGMQTLLERAKILQSKIDIKSQPNKGTTIILSIPN